MAGTRLLALALEKLARPPLPACPAAHICGYLARAQEAGRSEQPVGARSALARAAAETAEKLQTALDRAGLAEAQWPGLLEAAGIEDSAVAAPGTTDFYARAEVRWGLRPADALPKHMLADHLTEFSDWRAAFEAAQEAEAVRAVDGAPCDLARSGLSLPEGLQRTPEPGGVRRPGVRAGGPLCLAGPRSRLLRAGDPGGPAGFGSV